MNFLILGARKGSLGEAIRNALVPKERIVDIVKTAGISGEEDCVLSPSVIINTKWDHVICTIGVNAGTYDDIFRANVSVPMKYLETWFMTRGNPSHPGSFVFISSNSAVVPRSDSGPYCASKAALSMAVQCEARYVAKNRKLFGPTYVYGYEPCWINSTPMSHEVEKQFPTGTPMHRVPGGIALDKKDLASLIVDNLKYGNVLHGRNLRVDLGDQ